MSENIDFRKHYILVVDIETANDIDNALAYDIGFAVADRKGNIYERHSLMIAEMFINNQDLMQTAYYAKKLPSYWREYSNHERKLVGILTARNIVYRTMKKYRIKEVFAYNASFDRNGLDRSLRYLTQSKYRWFFPYGTKINCIWAIACQTILQQKAFFEFAQANGYIKNGRIQTTAEIAYRYICKDTSFTESHTGLADVEIETAILAKCIRQHHPFVPNVNKNCWTLVQKSFREFQKSA